MKKIIWLFLAAMITVIILPAAAAQTDLERLAESDPDAYERHILQNPGAVTENLDAYRIALENSPELAGRNAAAYEAAIASDIGILNQNPAAFRIYANMRGVNMRLSENSGFRSYSGGVFRTAGPGSTAFTLEDVQTLVISSGASEAMVEVDGSLVLMTKKFFFTSKEEIRIYNAEIKDGVISQAGSIPVQIRQGGELLRVDAGSVRLQEVGLMLLPGAKVSVDTDKDGTFDASISARDSTMLKPVLSCFDRDENCVGISDSNLMASGSGITIKLLVGQDGKALHSIRALTVFPRSRDYGTEIELQEETLQGKSMSAISFSKLGIAFRDGKRPSSINSIIVDYIDYEGRQTSFLASSETGNWAYMICPSGLASAVISGSCVQWGADESFFEIEEEFGPPKRSEETLYGSVYEYSTKKHGKVNVMVFDTEKVSVVPFVAFDSRGNPLRVFLNDMGEQIGGEVLGGVNGVMFASGKPAPTEAVVVDGTLYSRKRGWNSGFLDIRDGSVEIRRIESTQDIAGAENGMAGVLVLQEGEVTSYSTNGCQNTRNGFCHSQTQRTAVGVLPDGRIIVATFDRASIAGAGEAMKALGATDAITLDGGGSTRYVWRNDEVRHRKSENRRVNSGLFFVLE